MRRKSLLSAPSCSNSRRRRRQEPGPGARATAQSLPRSRTAPRHQVGGRAARPGRRARSRRTRLLLRPHDPGPGARRPGGVQGTLPARELVSVEHGRGTRDTDGERAPRVGAVFARSGQGALSGWTVGDHGAQLPGRHRREGASNSPAFSL